MSISLSAEIGLLIAGVLLILLVIPGVTDFISDISGRQVRSIWRNGTRYAFAISGVILILISLFFILKPDTSKSSGSGDSVSVGGDVENSTIIQSDGGDIIIENKASELDDESVISGFSETCIATSSSNSCIPVYDGPNYQAKKQIACLSSGTRVNLLETTSKIKESYEISSFYDDYNPIVVISISPDSPAEKAGLKIGDAILYIDDIVLSDTYSLQTYTKEHAGKSVALGILRDGREIFLNVVPRTSPPSGQGPIGFEMSGQGIQQGEGGYINAEFLYCNQNAVKTPRPTQTPVYTTKLGAICDALACNGDAEVRPVDNTLTVYVPEGSFLMGSEENNPLARSDEIPRHLVTLDGFWIDKTEITNAQFAVFLNENGNQANASKTRQSLQTHWIDLGKKGERSALIVEQNGSFVSVAGYESYPVRKVSWHGASAYCEWVGGHLPTEAQWEYAAKGPGNFEYPWGNGYPGETRGSFGNRAMAPVGSYPDGASWVGALDMAGNVWEWVQDYYAYYDENPELNPTGPTSGDIYVLRGGDWADFDNYVRTASRGKYSVTYFTYMSVGFRCAFNSTQ